MERLDIPYGKNTLGYLQRPVFYLQSVQGKITRIALRRASTVLVRYRRIGHVNLRVVYL
jgi:hypothetical protein